VCAPHHPTGTRMTRSRTGGAPERGREMPDREDLLRARCPPVAGAVALICWNSRSTVLGTISARHAEHGVGPSLGTGDVSNADNSANAAKRSGAEFAHPSPRRLGWRRSPSSGLRRRHTLRLPFRVHRTRRARQCVDAPILGHRNVPAEHGQVLSRVRPLWGASTRRE
jgi:hypothetical protein